MQSIFVAQQWHQRNLAAHVAAGAQVRNGRNFVVYTGPVAPPGVFTSIEPRRSIPVVPGVPPWDPTSMTFPSGDQIITPNTGELRLNAEQVVDLENYVQHPMVDHTIPTWDELQKALGQGRVTNERLVILKTEDALVPIPGPAPAQKAPALPWLDRAAVFVPKSIREPFLGDLREDLASMVAAGQSRSAVRWAAISQVAILVVRWLWSSGAMRLLRGGGP